MQPLIKKYTPKKISEVIGQQSQIREVINFIRNYKNKKKALLLFGPTGVGKTSSVHAIANDLNLEILEVNASDYRNAEQIELKVGNAIKQQSLFRKEKIILVDDIDGLSGREDRGGIQAIIKLLEESKLPVILTATNIYEEKLKALVKKCSLIEYSKLDCSSLFDILKRICINEDIKHTDESLKILAYSSAGDARSAINDLNMLSNGEITPERVKELTERDRKDVAVTALNKILKGTDFITAYHSFDNVDEDIDRRFLLIDENLPSEYKNPDDLSKAYSMLSKSDVFNGRIKRWQYYRFLVYVSALMTAGVAVSKQKGYRHYVQYKPTTRLLKIWIANQKLSKKKSIAQKISHLIHESKNQTLKSIMPYLPFIFSNKKIQDKMIAEFELSDDEIAWLKK